MKNRRIDIRVTEEEYKLLKKRCEELGGLSVSELFRKFIKTEEALMLVARNLFSPDD